MFDFLPMLIGIDDVAGAMIVSAAISAVVGIGTSLYNNWRQGQNNDAVLDAQEDTREWTAGQNQITRDREDNALQRRTADAQAAGLSPLAALGANTSQATPLNYTGQAGYIQPTTMDNTGVMQALNNLSTEFGDISRQNAQIKDNKDAREAHYTEFMAQLNSTEKMARASIESANEINDKQIAAKLVEIDQNYLKWSTEAQNVIGLENEKANWQQWKQQYDSFEKEAYAKIDFLKSMNVNPTVIRTSDWEEYKKGVAESNKLIDEAMRAWLKSLQKLTPEQRAIAIQKSSSHGVKLNNAGSFGFNFGENGVAGGSSWRDKMWKSFFGQSFGMNGSRDVGTSENDSDSIGMQFDQWEKIIPRATYFKNCVVYQYEPKYHSSQYKYQGKTPSFNARDSYNKYRK